MVFYTRQDIAAFDAARFAYIETGIKGAVFSITLNRPEKRNALNPEMIEEIVYALAFAHYSDMVQCIVIDAKGPVFCAGADLHAFQTADRTGNQTFPRSREELRLGDAFAQVFKPSVCLVEGPVLAGGFLIICGCTFVISTPEAYFGLPEVKRGLWPMQVTASLARVTPYRKVLEMAITANTYPAAEALNFGLITSIADKENIRPEGEALALKICENAPYAIRKGMSAFDQMLSLPDGERNTYLKKQLDDLLQSDDAKEGALAFKEKRQPIWKNR